VFTPQPMSVPVLGRAGCEVVEGLLGLRGIGFTANAKAERVEAGRVAFQGGGEASYELLAVPPHRCTQVLVEAGVAKPGGWVSVDPRTLETRYEGVSAVWDCTAIASASRLDEWFGPPG
jgi:sulfide:quinone oxidoreductase